MFSGTFRDLSRFRDFLGFGPVRAAPRGLSGVSKYGIQDGFLWSGEQVRRKENWSVGFFALLELESCYNWIPVTLYRQKIANNLQNEP